LTTIGKHTYLCIDHYITGKDHMSQLKNKVAIITGASSGIGHAAALLFASEGAKLIVSARRKDELDALVKEIKAAKGTAIAHTGEVADEKTHEALVALAHKEFGALHAAFNNAGIIGETGPTSGVSKSGWDNTIAVNLTAAFLAAKHQAPAMVKSGGGSMVFTGTFLGHTAAFPGVAAYAASKAGLIGLAQTLAVEFGPQGVRANVIMPGATDTPMYQAMNSTPEQQGFVKGLHALKRAARPEEIARSALYLLSDAASFHTGTSMLVDGGVSINRT
jgi:NAD(P)-dependent dehydrogenase (short-subunit alcohol dehydrogenase family)